MKACPLCLSTEVYASHRAGVLERRVLTWLGVLPFRCADCQTRVYRFAWRDPRRRARGPDPILWTERSRPPRWPLQVEASVSFDRPEEGPVSLKGMTENASLGGARLRLPERVPEGSQVEVNLQGGETASGSVRWNRPGQNDDVLHGLRLDRPWPPQSPSARPLRRLRRRRFLRRMLIGVVGLVLIGLAAWGIVWLMDAFRAYNPRYYEPKDMERERHELQRPMEEPSRTPKR